MSLLPEQVSSRLPRFLPIIIISSLTYLVWHKTLNQTFLGEGYYYFDRPQDFINVHGKITDIWQLDVFARLLFDILPPILGDNIRDYLIFQLVTVAVLNLSVYYTIRYFTKNPWVSLVATGFFLGSYAGSFEMLATGNYQRFAQRIPNLIPSLLAFVLLGKFLDTEKSKYLVGSFVLFAASLFMSHFSTFLLPLFAVFPLAHAVVFKHYQKVFRALLISAAFLGLNYLLISRGFHTPDVNLRSLIRLDTCNVAHYKCKDPQGLPELLERIILQIANITLPPTLIDKIASITNPFKDTLVVLTIFPILATLSGFFLLKKQAHGTRVLYLTFILSIPAILYLNLYVGKVDASFNMSGYKYYFLPAYYSNNIEFLTTVKGDRYYFIPSLLIATVVSLLIWSAFNKNSFKYKVVSMSVLCLYLLYNTNVIWTHLDRLQPVSEDLKNYLNYVKSISGTFTPDTILVVHQPFIWPSQYVRAFYGYPDTNFIPLKEGWEKELPQDKKNDLRVIDYDSQRKVIIDKTDYYKGGKSNYGKPR